MVDWNGLGTGLARMVHGGSVILGGFVAEVVKGDGDSCTRACSEAVSVRVGVFMKKRKGMVTCSWRNAKEEEVEVAGISWWCSCKGRLA